MALLSVLVRLAPRFGLGLMAHGVDHGLRPDAAAELDLAERFARDHGVPWDRTKVDVPRGGNLQARARAARWTALAGAARAHGATIATAHHAEDRAETVLMRVLRGSGARGLAVLPPRSPAAGASDIEVVRPLLRALRSDVVTHLERHRVPSATDPSNADPRFLRTRVRNEVLPLLRELDPAVVHHLSAIADDLTAAGSARAEAGWTAGLPRATQAAIAALVRSRSTEARVWLPDGLVAMVEPRRTK
ncbi:MAG: tRNA lysidine(34) synthetase TilS [Labilithrix sp.]|nr:tRNA lysidine(34) synthetase TilS [Labilithrix sp.]MCW5813517.1 tRNA lysidine(34) synthetase TilS [Labilithrix sp.]